MLNLGTGELVVIFLVALIVLGPSKLPDAARQMGRMAAELRRLSAGFQDEMRAAMQEPTPTLPPVADDRPTPSVRKRREPLSAHGAAPPEQPPAT